jgi:hypothetical protein
MLTFQKLNLIQYVSTTSTYLWVFLIRGKSPYAIPVMKKKMRMVIGNVILGAVFKSHHT